LNLSPAQFARAAEAEASQLRAICLQRMNARQLRELLSGDAREAAPWVRSAAEYGLPAAQLRLGRMLLEGEGVARNQELAVFWFTRAAEQGDAAAMNMLGRCFENGWGTRIGLESAAHWYELSATRAHDWGQYNFGNMLFDGRGIPPDRRRALEWYRRAARQGHSRAMNIIGRCVEEGWGCRINPAEAFEWYRLSAEYGYFRGQFNYAAALAERGCVSEAAEWFWKAALSGDDPMRRTIVKVLEPARASALLEISSRVAGLLV
jgi:TPR repeat protein